jgi:hypothetical protein
VSEFEYVSRAICVHFETVNGVAFTDSRKNTREVNNCRDTVIDNEMLNGVLSKNITETKLALELRREKRNGRI